MAKLFSKDLILYTVKTNNDSDIWQKVTDMGDFMPQK